ncbi:MAG: TonB-dependent receptor [Symploca sp. SIO2B6]|nr:TonB-dependent receptor [Symploca sp. SIO2B6]
MAQISESVVEPVQITDIQLNVTDLGLEITLVTESGTLPQPTIQQAGNALIKEIPNAVLDISGDDSFQQFDPTEGIVLIEALTVNEQTVRLTITGTDAPPSADITDESQNLVVNIAVGDPATAAVENDTIQVVVTGEEDSRYVEPNTSTATRTDTPLRDIPQSIQVIPREVIEDQQAIRLTDVVRNASGVVGRTNDSRGQAFISRGFSAATLRDGFRINFGGFSGNTGFAELSNLETVEVLKGPASILFGALEPGGVINLVSKQPSNESFYDLGFRAGNRELIEPNIDLSGPLTDDGRLTYRLNALYRNEESFRDFDTDIERFFVAPTLRWQISDRTDLTLSLEYSDDERPADTGLVAVGDEVADIPFDRVLGEPGDFAENETLRVGYDFEHRFSDRWRVRNAFRFTRLDTFQFNAFSGFAPFDETTGLLARNFAVNDQPSDTFELQTNVVGKFNTGSVGHTLLMGVDLYRREEVDTFLTDFSAPTFINIFDPVYGLVPRPDPDTLPVAASSSAQSDALGIYIQDQITLLDNLKLLAGVRYETIEQETTNNPSFFVPTASEVTQNDDAFSPRFGIVYQPIDPVSLYASYTRSFRPSFSTDVSGQPLEPERGEQVEVGVRAELLDGRLTTGLAFFNITKENVATIDPDNPVFSVAAGKQRSRGIELDVTGEILPGWNIISNYAFTDADTTEDNSGLEGNRIAGVPEHNFNVWTTYDIQKGPLEGLGFGLGANVVSDRFGDNANSFEVGSYVLTNAAIFYERDNWRAAVNIRNLLDIDYIEGEGVSRTFNIQPGEGFTIIGSLSVEL